jgi:hypothetical protein
MSMVRWPWASRPVWLVRRPRWWRLGEGGEVGGFEDVDAGEGVVGVEGLKQRLQFVGVFSGAVVERTG